MDRIRLKVLGLSYSMSQAGAYALILADEQDMHRIPIVIGMPEAQSIAIQLEKMQTQRPLTHDLIKKLADALQVTLKLLSIVWIPEFFIRNCYLRKILNKSK